MQDFVASFENLVARIYFHNKFILFYLTNELYTNSEIYIIKFMSKLESEQNMNI